MKEGNISSISKFERLVLWRWFRFRNWILWKIHLIHNWYYWFKIPKRWIFYRNEYVEYYLSPHSSKYPHSPWAITGRHRRTKPLFGRIVKCLKQ